ncbi:hypothetical protein [Flavobacterium caeni]|uniref:Protein SCO1/2 n=1 Tax=Flavobacterium caeni TaxID=490189 RepID=A0A1G5ICV4_9FLAO|nr:hypothetical protein [Flavobacterium caeni]SCY73208.1 hypothetical protein SAMN02927903_02207 [Flavobacterium caeni]
MKKKLILFTLFVVPIVAYLFFATGVHGFTHLPTVTPKVADFGDWRSTRNERISLNGKITILGFGGKDLLKNRGNLYNLQQKVYLRYHEFTDLQFVYLCPIGTEADAAQILEAMTATTDMSHWHFVFATPEEIQKFHSQLKLQGKLGPDFGTSHVYLLDKDRNLRGRTGEEYREGYNTFHPAELSNEMLDDFKVMLYEYRAAYKKNNNASPREI